MKPHMININIHQSGQGILLEVLGCLFKVDNLWHKYMRNMMFNFRMFNDVFNITDVQFQKKKIR